MPAAGNRRLPGDVLRVGPSDRIGPILRRDAIEPSAAPHRPVFGVNRNSEKKREESREVSREQGVISEAGSASPSAGVIMRARTITSLRSRIGGGEPLLRGTID